jgi:uncharacterized protein YdaU (DUF1376 family)
MDWYPFYFTLYEQDTMHLNPYQDGCYRRLIDHYMKTRAPLPDNDTALARIVGDSEANWVAMASLLVRPFFRAQSGRLFHTKCDEILDDQDNRTNKLSVSGKKGAEKRWSKIKYIDSPPNGHPIATPMGSAIAQDKYNTVKDISKDIYKKKLQKPEDVSQEVWDDFITHRKAKKASITQTVINGYRTEASKAGFTLEQAIMHSITQGWQGFKADWVTTKGTTNGQLTHAQRIQAALDSIPDEETPDEYPESPDKPELRYIPDLREAT